MAERAESDRQKPLISPVPVDAIVDASAKWEEVDDRYIANLRAINSHVELMRKQIRAVGITPDERAGTQFENASAAVTAINVARERITQALQTRERAKAEVAAAEKASESALLQAADVLTARRAITAIIVLIALVYGIGLLNNN